MSISTEGSVSIGVRSVGSVPESPPGKITKHGSLYFENGNIVLFSLPKENVVTAFKVYRDHLINISPIFEGMLSMPTSPDTEKHDGVPLVRLHDGPEQLIPFLEAIYDPMAMPSMRDFYLSFDKVERFFKLCKKYQAEKLLKFMQTGLSKMWPKALRSWDNTMKNGKDYTGFILNDYVLESALPEPCFTIRLAREYGVPEILPAAFYYLLRISPLAFSHSGSPDGENWGAPLGPEAKFTYLSRHDIMCFVRGSHAIREFIRRCYEHPPVPGKACYTINSCNNTFQLFLRARRQDVAYLNCDGLQLLQNSCPGLCTGCTGPYIQLVEEQRSELWNSLPVFFGLERSKPEDAPVDSDANGVA